MASMLLFGNSGMLQKEYSRPKSFMGFAFSSTSEGDNMSRKLLLVLLAMVVCLFATTAFGQSETGQIAGSVLDPQNKAVVGATVVAKSVATGAERTVNSGDDGRYSITNLQPGLYDVT